MDLTTKPSRETIYKHPVETQHMLKETGSWEEWGYWQKSCDLICEHQFE
jgi:hypothetical protein